MISQYTQLQCVLCCGTLAILGPLQECLLCRMKPEYMGPESPVKMEFKEFCAANAMDSKHSPAVTCPP